MPLERWEGDVTFINKRFHHSQSQGLIERGNLTVEQNLAAIKEEKGHTGDHHPWASCLPQVMFSLNIELQNTIKDSPYNGVFGRCPTSGVFPGASNLLDEEDMEDIIPNPASAQTPAPDSAPASTAAGLFPGALSLVDEEKVDNIDPPHSSSSSSNHSFRFNSSARSYPSTTQNPSSCSTAEGHTHFSRHTVTEFIHTKT